MVSISKTKWLPIWLVTACSALLPAGSSSGALHFGACHLASTAHWQRQGSRRRMAHVPCCQAATCGLSQQPTCESPRLQASQWRRPPRGRGSHWRRGRRHDHGWHSPERHHSPSVREEPSSKQSRPPSAAPTASLLESGPWTFFAVRSPSSDDWICPWILQ